MIFNGETEFDRRARLQKWHRHFCIIPRHLSDGRWAWMQTVWRRHSGRSYGVIEHDASGDGHPQSCEGTNGRPSTGSGGVFIYEIRK